jgi:hypothetical protein
LGSGISYKNLLKYSYFVIFASLFLWSARAGGQVSNQTSLNDTTRKSPLKLKDVSGIPWESAPKATLFLDNPSNIKSTVTYDAEKNEYVLFRK